MGENEKREFLENYYLGRLRNRRESVWNDSTKAAVKRQGHTDDEIANATDEQIAHWLPELDSGGINGAYDNWHRQYAASTKERYMQERGLTNDSWTDDNENEYRQILKNDSPKTYSHIYENQGDSSDATSQKSDAATNSDEEDVAPVYNGDYYARLEEEELGGGDQNQAQAQQPIQGDNQAVPSGDSSQASVTAAGQAVVGAPSDATAATTVQPETPTKVYSNDIAGIGEKGADALRRTGQTTADAIKQAGSDAAGKLQDINDGLYGENGTVTTQQRDLKDYLENNAYKNIEQALTDYADQLKAAETEKNEEVKADYRAATWTGLTELAASLVNLIGVGSGAVSQQYKSYSQDWMKKADADLKYHRSRIQNLRERQNALRMHMDQLKAADMKSLSDLAIRAAEKKAAGEMQAVGFEVDAKKDAAKIVGETNKAAISAETSAAIEDKRLEANKQLHREDRASKERQHKDDNETRLAIYGITKNEDGTYNIPAGAGKKTSGTGSKASNKAIAFTVSQHGDKPQETFCIDPDALRTNVYAALASKSITDLSEDDQNEITRILGQSKGRGSSKGKSAKDISDELIPYVTKSEQLRKILRGSGVSTFDAPDDTSDAPDDTSDAPDDTSDGVPAEALEGGDDDYTRLFGGGPTAENNNGSVQGGFWWSGRKA